MKKQSHWLLHFVLFCSFLLAGCSQTDQELSHYLETGTDLDEEAKGFMPVLDALPPYEVIAYRHTKKKMFLFEANSVLLNVQYDTTTYAAEKEKSRSKQVETHETFEINSYTFQLVEASGYPKSFGLIGTSDEKKAIAFLYFYDFDLDRIDASLKAFVKDYFDYHF